MSSSSSSNSSRLCQLGLERLLGHYELTRNFDLDPLAHYFVPLIWNLLPACPMPWLVVGEGGRMFGFSNANNQYINKAEQS